MTDITAEELAKVNSFPRLVDLLRDKLEWPIPEDYGLEDVVFEYEPHELGLKDEDAAKLREIHQLRPLVTGQPWGIFFLSFENKAMSVTVLRRILRKLVVTKRGDAKDADRAAWLKEDLIFAANFGQSGERELAFVHFSDAASTGDLPVMKVLGWNARDTLLHNRHAAGLLSKQLGWPDDAKDQAAWRNQWASAFEVGHREVITTSQELAKRLAALAGDIRARANQLLDAETETGPMRTMLEAFRKNLIHDLDEDGFADMFAQTICYGMLAARIARPVGIIADNLADMVPKTNPFLKELFANFLHIGGRDKRQGMDFDELGVRDVVDLLNSKRTVMEAVLRDFGDKNPKEDPVIHFYELFLKEYDPQKRMQRGVFYTPRPVVNFIVRGVDEILRTEFNLPLGLADTSTWAELAARNDKITVPTHVDPNAPFVQILDPATGTGTFLVEVIDLIHTRMVDTWQAESKSAAEIKAAWNAYVPQHLLPRLTAFELMMAPYAIAHMKIGLKLVETGYTFGSDERAHVFLTNALEPVHDLDMAFDFMSSALAHEAKAANEAKEKVPFTVVVGNPPYAGHSRNNNIPSIVKLVGDYSKNDPTLSGPGQGKWLQDDYVKFFRFSTSLIQKSGSGCLGIITNHRFLTNRTFRGMRKKLMSDFRELSFVDLHGNITVQEVSPTGNNENVFDIEQGVAISLISLPDQSTECKIRLADVWGDRDEKYSTLADNPNLLNWVELSPRPPLRLFAVSSPEEVDDQYGVWPSIVEVMPNIVGPNKKPQSGLATMHDGFAIGFQPQEVEANIEQFLSSRSRGEAAEIFGGLCNPGQWDYHKAKRFLASSKNWKDKLTPLYFAPFDLRYTVFDKNVAVHLRRKLSDHLYGKFNIAMVVSSAGQEVGGGDWDGISCVDSILQLNFFRRNGSPTFPLYDYGGLDSTGQRPNLSEAFAANVASNIGIEFKSDANVLANGHEIGPRDLFDYIYAVLHAPSYRSRYAEFLKSDFPRIPTPGTRALFAALVPLGRELVALHLLKADEAPALKNPDIRFAGTGEARVAKGYPTYENGKVMINPSRWFEDVPKATYEFHVGGYQPCEKWLKDRAAKGGKKQSDGRVLTDEDTLHYRRMVVALTETRSIMAEIDTVIANHGGWPGAFKVGAA